MTQDEMLSIATCCDPMPPMRVGDGSGRIWDDIRRLEGLPVRSSANSVSFTVPGQPVAKGRARFARRGNFVQAYTPEKTAKYENLVKLAAMEAMQGAGPMQGPIRLGVSILLQIPASWSKRKQAQAIDGLVAATKKPDADNVLKAVKDGMNGVVYLDDAQAVEIRLVKRYAAVPGVAVVAEELALEKA